MTSAAAPLYLDACATTPLAPGVQEAMERVQATAWGNPSSLHGFGLAAAEALERSRETIAAALGTQSKQLLFTSGGTESLHLALLGAARCLPVGRLLISAVEHPAGVAAARQLEGLGWQVSAIPVDRAGLLDLKALASLLAPPTRLVSVIWGQSEVGTIQPIEAIGALCRAAGVLFHTDAVQVVGQQELNFHALPVDLLSLTAHKLQGPRGIGGLLVRPGVALEPLLKGGAQEGGRRAGTEPVALAAGFAAAINATRPTLQVGPAQEIAELRNRLLAALVALPGVSQSGAPPGPQRLPHHISLLLAGATGQPLSGRALVRALWSHGLAVSSGSACSSGLGSSSESARGQPSAVLLAMGYPRTVATSGLRLSLGPWLPAAAEVLERVPPAIFKAMAELQ